MDYFWTSVGAVALLVLQFWMQHEIKARGWTGVTQTLGNIGLVSLIIYGVLALTALAFSIAVNITAPMEYISPFGRRLQVWTVSAAAPIICVGALMIFHKNLMLFLSGIVVWVGVVIVAPIFVRGPDVSESYSVFLAGQIEQAHGFMVMLYWLLAIVTIVSSAISALYRHIATLTKPPE